MKDLRFLNNLVHTTRWSGHLTLKSESISDHVWGMVALAIQFHEQYDPSGVVVDLKEVIYRVALHDIGESLYCDIPRPFKYSSPQLARLINTTEEELLRDNLSKSLVDDIQSAKDPNSIEGLLVKILDALQAGLKMKSEIELGNNNFRAEIGNSINMLKSIYSSIKYNNDIKYTTIHKFINDSIQELTAIIP